MTYAVNGNVLFPDAFWIGEKVAGRNGEDASPTANESEGLWEHEGVTYQVLWTMGAWYWCPYDEEAKCPCGMPQGPHTTSYKAWEDLRTHTQPSSGSA